jgi:hypothetical protein
VDITIDNPVGRVPDPRRMTVRELRATPDGWRLGRRHGGWGGTLATTLGRLDETHELRLDDAGVTGAAAAELAGYLHRAAARGTYVTSSPGPALRAALPARLADTLLPPRADRAGDLAWDIRSVLQRRAALQPLFPRWPSVSLVLVSRRPELVVPLVARLARVAYPQLELVVGLHGAPAPDGLSEAAGDLPLVVREFPVDQVFGSVLHDAFAAASGELVAKVDDDDYMSDEHVRDLVMAHGYSGATLVGKSTTIVYLEAIDTTVRRLYGARESFTHRVAGSTFLLSPEDLRAVGGWEPLPRAVDTALLEAVRRHGGTVYQPHDIGYLYRRSADASGHTWTTGIDHFLRNTREQWVGLLRHPEFGTEGEQ